MDDTSRRHEAAPPDEDGPAGERPERGSPASNERFDAKRPDDKSDEKPQDPKEKRSRWPLIILGIAIVIAIIAGLIYWLLTKDQQGTDDAYTDGRAIIVAPHISGYVSALLVNDNQRVRAGDVLVEIEQRDYLAARDQARGQFEAAQAQLDSARVALDKAKISFPAQLAQAQGVLAQARGQLFQAESEAKRQHSVDRAATSQQNVDNSTAALQQARGQEQQAEAQVQQASLIDQNIAQAEAQVKQLEGQVMQAKANLDQAEINLGYTRITAPQDGWVTRRNVEQGNYVQAGAQIMAVVTPEVWVTANFKETELARMRIGQRVDIRVDAYPDLKLSGHVDSVQLGSGTKFTAFPPENATGNFIKIVQRVPVKIVIDSGLDPNFPLPLGVSVTPTVALK